MATRVDEITEERYVSCFIDCRFRPLARASGDRNSEEFFHREARRIEELEKEVERLKREKQYSEGNKGNA